MRIAIIGGIGSGKSEVLKVAKDRGLCVASADEINARLLTRPDYIDKIDKTFIGVVQDGVINKNALASIVFSDKRKLSTLNSIAHPEIIKEINECSLSPYIVEMPLILEVEKDISFDEIVLVYTPFLKRLRLLKGRGMTYRDAIKRIRLQHSTSELKRIATRVICNDKDIASLKSKANALFDELLSK